MYTIYDYLKYYGDITIDEIKDVLGMDYRKSLVFLAGYELDIENSFENGISIIEWPEIADDIIYNIAVDIEIVILQDNSRIFNVKFA